MRLLESSGLRAPRLGGKQLAAALRGDLKKGLFFRGAGALPFGNQIRSVRELMTRMLTAPHAAVAG